MVKFWGLLLTFSQERNCIIDSIYVGLRELELCLYAFVDELFNGRPIVTNALLHTAHCTIYFPKNIWNKSTSLFMVSIYQCTASVNSVCTDTPPHYIIYVLFFIKIFTYLCCYYYDKIMYEWSSSGNFVILEFWYLSSTICITIHNNISNCKNRRVEGASDG